MPTLESPLPPDRIWSRLDEYTRDWRESRLPAVLRQRGLVSLKLARIPSGFRLQLNRGAYLVDCVAQLSEHAGGTTITYVLPTRRGVFVSVAISWAVLLAMALRFPRPLQAIGLVIPVIVVNALITSIRVDHWRTILTPAVEEILRSVAQTKDHAAAS